MCVTTAPALLSNTILLASEASLNGQIVHVLGYQNTVQNLSVTLPPPPLRTDDDWNWNTILKGAPDPSMQPMGNAMILPFPAVPGSMTRDNVVSTEKSPGFLEEMAKLAQPVKRAVRAASSKSVRVFDHGIYTIVLASQARAIPDALETIPPEKRPAIGAEFFEPL